MTLVDTNVLLDLVTNDLAWADWRAAGLLHRRACCHARLTLFTRDAQRYRSYFPGIDLITP